MIARYVVELLAQTHNRGGFASGSEQLDRYLQQQVGQDIRRRVASCFVARPFDDLRVHGFYTVSIGGASLENFPIRTAKKLPKYPSIPAARIGRLAVDINFRGLKLGSALLLDALTRAIRSDIAAFAVVVDAKDEPAAAFYRHHGFVPFAGETLRLFLPLGEAARRLGGSEEWKPG